MSNLGRTPLGEQVHDRIAKALLTGQMRPNDRLTIRGLADRLGVSTTPGRDAVKQLTQENVLERRSPKNMRVPEHATERQIRDLRRLLDRNDRAIEKRRWADATEGNLEFHLALSNLAGMPVLQKILKGLWVQMGPLVACYHDTEPDGLNAHHYDLLQAMTERESLAARRAIEADILSARPVMLAQVAVLRERLVMEEAA